MSNDEANPTATLPAVYQRWVDALLPGPIPAESKATCDDCAMCGEPGEPRESEFFFLPSVKCCGYVPELPNFLVGLGLGDPESRPSLRRRIVEGRGVSPLGIARDATQARDYKEAMGRTGFGRGTAVLCPHFVGERGRCAIWRYRNGVCTTWFCKHDRGNVGSAFWAALERLLTWSEVRLAFWCLESIDIELEALDGLLRRAEHGLGAGVPGEAGVRPVDPWGGWQDRREALFESCARLVEPLSWDDVLEACGPDVRKAADEVKRAYDALCDRTLPSRLRFASCETFADGSEHLRVVGYSRHDPLRAPRALLKALPAFDGGAVDGALQRIEREHGLQLDRTLIRKLVDFRLLVPPDDPPAS